MTITNLKKRVSIGKTVKNSYDIYIDIENEKSFDLVYNMIEYCYNALPNDIIMKNSYVIIKATNADTGLVLAFYDACKAKNASIIKIDLSDDKHDDNTIIMD